jgi:glyoxylase I family protein
MTNNEISLNHASMVVADAAKSVKFYAGVLGLQQVERPDLGFPGAWFQLGEQQIHILELETMDPVTGRPEHGGRDRHVALSVAALSPFKEKFEQEDIMYTMSKSGRKALFCRDPDGNAIELIERD